MSVINQRLSELTKPDTNHTGRTGGEPRNTQLNESLLERAVARAHLRLSVLGRVINQLNGFAAPQRDGTL